MAERAMAVEEKLSDALHERLTQRFVDRRTSVLMRDLGRKGAGEFPVIIDEQGEVSVGSYAIGRLQGFSFEVDPAARRRPQDAARHRRAAAAGEYEKRAAALVADSDQHFSLRTEPDKRSRSSGAATRWPGSARARTCCRRVQLDRGSIRSRARPRRGSSSGSRLDPQAGRAHLAPLRAAGSAAQDRATPAPVRSVLACWSTRAASSPASGRRAARRARPRAAPRGHRLGVRIGALDLFMPAVLKPEAMRWRSALRAAAAGSRWRGSRRRPAWSCPRRPTARAGGWRGSASAPPAPDDPRRHGRPARPSRTR